MIETAADPGPHTAIPQAELAGPLTRAAIFLVATVNTGDEDSGRIIGGISGAVGLVRAVGARDPAARLSCVVGIGSEAWSRIAGSRRPRELHAFREIESGGRFAPSTPGDLLFHIRADRHDLCFELATGLLASLGNSVQLVDEVQGFQYFDDRDLIGFVDGTENPVGTEAEDAAIVGDEDPPFMGGSYVTVQKYVHDLAKWEAIAVEEQEAIIGRTKLEDIELDEATKPSFAHNALTNLVVDGKEIKILRRNMPFGAIGQGDSGTYFIAYSRSPQPVEQMLQNMFIGDPPGNFDRLLNFTRAVTGTNFFAPSRGFLDTLGAAGPAPVMTAGVEAHATVDLADGSLRIGSLRGVSQHE